MALDQQTANLIDTTVNAFNGDATSISLMDGISLIDSWTSALRNTDPGTNAVASGLSSLKAELQSGNPDGTLIQSILEDLTDQVRQVAVSAETDVKTKLDALTEALQGFSQQLGGSSKPLDAQNQQAPMTSTVGGESTNSGVGASARNTNGDDALSDRSPGGTFTTNDSAMGMDDSTGSDGGFPQDSTRVEDGGSYGSGYGTGSEGDDYSSNSGTQRSGVSGGSTGSGSGGTDTGSSGGRSQY